MKATALSTVACLLAPAIVLGQSAAAQRAADNPKAHEKWPSPKSPGWLRRG